MVINKTIGRWGGPDNLTSLGTNISQGKKNVRAGSARERKNAPPGGLEPPTFRLTAERASQLRHGGRYNEPSFRMNSVDFKLRGEFRGNSALYLTNPVWSSG